MELLRVVPNECTNREDTPAVVEGRHFFNRASVDLDDPSPPDIERGWRFSIPDTFAVEQPATRSSDTTLEIVVPNSLPRGWHDLTVTSPSGESETLANALLVDAGIYDTAGTGGAAAGGAGGATPGLAGSAGAAAGEGGTAGAGGAAGGGTGGASGAAGGSGTLGDLGELEFGPPMAIVTLSSPELDDDPTFTADLRELYFSSARNGGGGPSPVVSGDNLWVSKRAAANEPWPAPERVDELNSTAYDALPGISGDGLTIWVSTDRDGGEGDFDIWRFTRNGRSDSWGAGTPVAEINSSSEDLAPHVSGGGRRMVFTSRRPAEHAGRNLFIASRQTLTDPWEEPIARSELNSSGDDSEGRLVWNGLVMVFSSDRPGSNGRDLYYAVRESLKDPFSEPQPVPGVNSLADDSDPWLSEDLSYMMFSSDRSGNTELYQTWRR